VIGLWEKRVRQRIVSARLSASHSSNNPPPAGWFRFICAQPSGRHGVGERVMPPENGIRLLKTKDYRP
jgi:hypothetical protein